jgi:quercetin dioxygenase-like cupin family protein
MINNHKINFDSIEWTIADTGVRYKAFIHGNQRLRLVEFSDGFFEQDWCVYGHAGIVLDGSFSIDFNGNVERYSSGDVIFIPSGEPDKHKAILEKNEKVTLLLFELINT